MKNDIFITRSDASGRPFEVMSNGPSHGLNEIGILRLTVDDDDDAAKQKTAKVDKIWLFHTRLNKPIDDILVYRFLSRLCALFLRPPLLHGTPFVHHLGSAPASFRSSGAVDVSLSGTVARSDIEFEIYFLSYQIFQSLFQLWKSVFVWLSDVSQTEKYEKHDAMLCYAATISSKTM